MYEELALERLIKESFGINLDLYKSIVFKAPVSRTGEATLFLTEKKQLYVLISGQTKFLLSDIKKIVARMGLKAESYLPPKGRPHYFDEIGRSKFHDVFPGRSNVSEDDIIFYRTLAPYTPALVLISEVKDGHVYQYDVDSTGDWRIAAKFTYRRIRTS